MEARRRELLSEENGYWRKRMAQELQQRALAEDASTDAKPVRQACFWLLRLVDTPDP